MAAFFQSGAQTIPAGATQYLTFDGFRVAAPTFAATGDAVTQTIQNASGDDGIALLSRGAYQVVGQFTQAQTPPSELLAVSWFGLTVDLLPASWASDSRGATNFRKWLGVAQTTILGWSAAGPPGWFGVLVSNFDVVDIDISGFTVLVTFWPGLSVQMTTIY